MSAPVFMVGSSVAWADIDCMVYRVYDKAGAPWRVSLGIKSDHATVASHAACPTARATVDDFGTLVIVEGWI